MRTCFCFVTDLSVWLVPSFHADDDDDSGGGGGGRSSITGARIIVRDGTTHCIASNCQMKVCLVVFFFPHLSRFFSFMPVASPEFRQFVHGIYAYNLIQLVVSTHAHFLRSKCAECPIKSDGRL